MAYAIELAKRHCCHAAIVDMRLFDDTDRHDQSGLSLIPKLSPTKVIIVTGHVNRTALREAFRNQGAFDMTGKQDSPEELQKTIQSAVF